MLSYKTGLPSWTDAKPVVFRLVLLAGDLAAVCAAYALAYRIRFFYPAFLKAFPVTKGVPGFDIYVMTAPVVLFMWTFAIVTQGGSRRIGLPALDELIRVFRQAAVGTVLAMSALFLYREASYSRLVFVGGGVLSFLLIYGGRQTIKFGYLFWVRRNRRPSRVLILGGGYLSNSLKKIMERQGDRAVLRMSRFEPDAVRRAILRSRINEVLVAEPSLDHKLVVKLAEFCEENRVACRLIPDILEIRMGEVLVDESLGVPTIQLKPVSLHGTAFVIKRVMDVMISSFVLGLFFIPLAAIAALIKASSPGPVLYRHKRVGYRGRSFDFLKFRTMVPNADDLLAKLKTQSDRGGGVFKMKKDPRVTAIGRILRRYSIDELPQLINVLKGEMSLVGPRPQVLWETEAYDEWARKRLNVLPGITGLWQVSGRAELTYEEMIELDIFYIEHWSPGLDIKIILKTVPAVLQAKGAY